VKKSCKYCAIPNRELTSKDYFDKIELWSRYVKEGLFEFKGGDTSLADLREEISREEKFAYYHYFKCDCGNYIRTGVCIRSSVPILEYINELPAEIDKDLQNLEKVSSSLNQPEIGHKLLDTEIKILKEKYNESIQNVKKISVITILIAVIALLLPIELWNIIIIPRKRLHNLPEIVEPMYENVSMIIILIIIVTLTPILTYYGFSYLIKKDLKYKDKIRGIYKIERIENLSKMVAKKLDGLDTVLHFEKNEFKIKKHLFNKSKNPELLKAKSILIECSKYSRTIFKEKIIIDDK
tara:strand:+ start:1265 stop:2149 length:885 start_codon:yes stop_codon:yes gene_type:complete